MSEYVKLKSVPAWNKAREFLQKIRDEVLVPMRDDCVQARELLQGEIDRLRAENGSTDPASAPVDGHRRPLARDAGTGKGPSQRKPLEGSEKAEPKC